MGILEEEKEKENNKNKKIKKKYNEFHNHATCLWVLCSSGDAWDYFEMPDTWLQRPWPCQLESEHAQKPVRMSHCRGQ